jgi:hypothetical protein
MSKHEKLFEIVAFAVAALALALFFAAMAALIVVEPEVFHVWMRGGFR